MATLADYYIQIVPSAEGIKGKLESALGEEADGAGKSAGSKFTEKFKKGLGVAAKGAAVAFGAAAAGIGAIAKQSVEAYANYEQLIGGVQTLFTPTEEMNEYVAKMGEIGVSAEEAAKRYNAGADLVMQNANNAFKTAGMSANEYMETVTSFSASLLQGLDGDTVAAAKYSDKAVTDMADNANKMGTSIESIQTAYQGFAKGQFQLLDNLKLGYGGTKTEMLRLVKDAGVVDESVQSIDDVSFDQIIEGIHIIQENMGIAGTTAEEASSTISGSLGMVQASWANLLTGMADKNADMNQLITNLIDSVGIAAENLLPVLETALTGIATTIEKLVPAIMERLPNLISDVLPQIAISAVSILQAIVDGLMNNAEQISTSVMDIFMTFTNAVINMAPTLLDLGLTILENLLNGIGENLDTIIPMVTGVILQITSTLISHIDELVSAGLTIFMGLVDGLIQAIPMIIEQIPVLLESIITEMNNSLGMIAEAGVTLFSSLVQALPDIIDAITQALPEIIDCIIDYYTNGGLEQTIQAYMILMTSMVQALPEIIKTLNAAIPQIILSIVKALTSRKGDMSNAGHTLFTSIGSKASVVGNEIKTKLHDVVTGWVDKLKGFVSNFTIIGEDLLTGLWNGMNNKVGWILSKVSDLGNSIVKKAKSIFKESSPSKVFYDIGDNLGIGLGLGWEDSMKDVNKQINDDLNYEGNVKLSTSLDDAAASQIRKASADITANIPKQSEVSLDGAQIVLYETLSLDGTNIKEIMADYTVRKIGSDMRAVKTSRGGRYGVL